MFVGMLSPLSVNRKGGAVTVSGSDLIWQLLITALRDCTSANPFQDLGISDQLIFSIDDQQSVASLNLAIQRIFMQFEANQLARLVKGDRGIVFSKSAEGQLDCEISYVDLETDKNETLSGSYSANSGWSRR
jgi:hypothetical protein